MTFKKGFLIWLIVAGVLFGGSIIADPETHRFYLIPTIWILLGLVVFGFIGVKALFK